MPRPGLWHGGIGIGAVEQEWGGQHGALQDQEGEPEGRVLRVWPLYADVMQATVGAPLQQQLPPTALDLLAARCKPPWQQPPLPQPPTQHTWEEWHRHQAWWWEGGTQRPRNRHPSNRRVARHDLDVALQQ